jgi:hypothetical protein
LIGHSFCNTYETSRHHIGNRTGIWWGQALHLAFVRRFDVHFPPTTGLANSDILSPSPSYPGFPKSP